MSDDSGIDGTERKRWSSEVGFIAAMAAAAVGLGNLWRFPYMVGENGGGAFLIAFVIALVVVVMPMMVLEVAAGRLAQGNAVATFRSVHRWGTWYGWAVVAITTVITSYYLVITGWTLGYAVDAVVDEVQPFPVFTEGYRSLWFFIATTVLAGVVLIRGVATIEWLSKLLMPVLVIVMIVLAVMASRTDGWDKTVDYFFTVEWSRLAEPSLWGVAFGQAFYTLAIGQGYLVTYGSYIPKRTNLPRACIIVTIVETMVAFLACWMIFPFLFAHDIEPDEGSQLAFVALPQAFAQIEGGAYLAIAFFALFFAAAFSSSLAGLKVLVAAVSEEWRLKNIYAVGIVIGVMLLLGTASALSFTPLEWTLGGEPVLEAIDTVVGGVVIIVSGVVGATLLGWALTRSRLQPALGTTHKGWSTLLIVVGRSVAGLMLLGLLATGIASCAGG